MENNENAVINMTFSGKTIQKHISIDAIIVSDRYRKDYGDVNALALSIKENGLINPITVQATDDDKYILIAGGRRLEAVKQLKWTKITATVYPKTISSDLKLKLELYENTDRKALTYVEILELQASIHNEMSQLYGTLLPGPSKGEGWTAADTAKYLNVSPGTLSVNLSLHEEIQKNPELGKLPKKSDVFKAVMSERKKQATKILSKKLSTMNEDMSDRSNRLISSYLIGDAIEGIKSLPNDTIDLFEIDPPYGIDLHSKRKVTSKMDDYFEQDPAEYPKFIHDILSNAYQKLKDGRWLIIWHPWDYVSLIVDIARKVGFVNGHDTFIWLKPQGQSMRVDTYMAHGYESALYFRKGSAFLQTKGHINVFSYPLVHHNVKSHPTERPIDMITEVLRQFIPIGSKVVSPFLGSGNTIFAAANLQSSCVGWDLNQTYKNSFIANVHRMQDFKEFSSYRLNTEVI